MLGVMWWLVKCDEGPAAEEACVDGCLLFRGILLQRAVLGDRYCRIKVILLPTMIATERL